MHENKILDRVRKFIPDVDRWQHLPPDFKIARVKCLVFRMLPRLGCSVERDGRLPNSILPTKMLLRLASYDLWHAAVSDVDECELNEYCSIEVLEPYTGRLDSDDLEMTLYGLALQMYRDIGGVELWVADLRRLITRTQHTRFE